MVVEDNQNILFNIELILDLNGYEVISALNGGKAIELLSQIARLPDLIISDIIMPKMDGYDFFKELSLNPKYSNIPFIFVSAKSTPTDIRLGKLIGADDYLTKPFKEEELLDIIEEKLNKAKLLELIKIKIKEALKSMIDSSTLKKSIIVEEKYFLYLIIWDLKDGLKFHKSFPEKDNRTESVNIISDQVFNTFRELTKDREITLPESILVDLPVFKKQGFFYLDNFIESDIEKKFILALIGPDLSYFKSLILKKNFTSIADEFKINLKIDLKSSWDDVNHSISE